MKALRKYYYTEEFVLAPNEAKKRFVQGDFLTVYELSGASLDEILVSLNEGELVKASYLLPASTPFYHITVKNVSSSEAKVKFLVGMEYYRVLQQGVRILSDQSTITARLNDILAQLDVALSTRASESTLAGIKAQTDKLQFDANNFLRSTIASSEIQVPIDLQSILPKKAELYGADETVAQEISLDVGGFKLVEVYAEATASTIFYIDFSFDNVHWFNYYTSASAENKVNKVFWTGAQYIRVRSDPAGATGDTVTLIIGAKP